MPPTFLPLLLKVERRHLRLLYRNAPRRLTNRHGRTADLYSTSPVCLFPPKAVIR
jgi:hypothetical protein